MVDKLPFGIAVYPDCKPPTVAAARPAPRETPADWLDGIPAELAAVALDRDEAYAELQTAVRDRDQVIDQRDQARAERDELGAILATVKRERREALAELDKAQREVTQLRGSLLGAIQQRVEAEDKLATAVALGKVQPARPRRWPWWLAVAAVGWAALIWQVIP